MSLVSETVNDAGPAPDEYCICRGSYGNKFMIGCDGCEEWFHGTCIKIDSDAAKFVEKYYCPFCLEKDPTLKTIYKPHAKERMREKEKQREKERHREREKERSKKKEHRKSKAAVLDSDPEDHVRKPKLEISKKKSEHKLQFTKKSKEDKEVKAKDKEVKVKDKEVKVKDKEVKVKDKEVKAKDKEVKEENTGKVKVKEEKVKCNEAAKLPKPVKEDVKQKAPDVKAKHKEDRVKEAAPKEEKLKDFPPPQDVPPIKEKKKKEEAKERKVDFSVKEKKAPVIEDSDTDDDVDFNSFLSRIAPGPVSSEEDEEVDVGVESMVLEREQVKETPPPKDNKPKHPRKKGRPKKKQLSSQKSVDGSKKEQESSEEEEKQCLGPGCNQAARRSSRYCGEECGVQLAIKRIKTFLPERKEEMTRSGVARQFDESMIQDLEEQQKIAHQKVEELQKLRVVIMKLSENAKATKYEGGSDDEMSDEEIETEGIDCVTCGMACSNKTAVKHMERCYNKFESQLSLGSTVKCGITWESPVCDAYDRQQGSYCKKLKVLCPDHNKEKEEHDGICGCPVDLANITEDSPVCVRSKRGCNRHISWEKLRLAEIDMERIQQSLKLEDSFDDMRKVKYRMANRTNLLQILLNGTIYHGTGSYPGG